VGVALALEILDEGDGTGSSSHGRAGGAWRRRSRRRRGRQAGWRSPWTGMGRWPRCAGASSSIGSRPSHARRKEGGPAGISPACSTRPKRCTRRRRASWTRSPRRKRLRSPPGRSRWRADSGAGSRPRCAASPPELAAELAEFLGALATEAADEARRARGRASAGGGAPDGRPRRARAWSGSSRSGGRWRAGPRGRRRCGSSAASGAAACGGAGAGAAVEAREDLRAAGGRLRREPDPGAHPRRRRHPALRGDRRSSPRRADSSWVWTEGSATIFLAEIGVRLALVPGGRLRWFVRHLPFDVLPSIPFGLMEHALARLDVARAGRIARLLRLERIARYVRAVRPFVRLFRVLAFLLRGLDRLVHRNSRLLNRDDPPLRARADRDGSAGAETELPARLEHRASRSSSSPRGPGGRGADGRLRRPWCGRSVTSTAPSPRSRWTRRTARTSAGGVRRSGSRNSRDPRAGHALLDERRLGVALTARLARSSAGSTSPCSGPPRRPPLRPRNTAPAGRRGRGEGGCTRSVRRSAASTAGSSRRAT